MTATAVPISPLESRTQPELVGDATPRVSTRRPVGESKGPEVIRFAADRLDVQLLPWQEHVLTESLVVANARWASRTVGIMVARQNGKTRLVTVRALAGMVLWGEQVIAASQNRDV